MKLFKNYDFRRFDFISVILIVILFVISYYAVGSATLINSVEGTDRFATKQLYGFLVGLVLMFGVAIFDYKFIAKFAIPIYLLNIGLLVMVRFLGVEVNNAVRWVRIAGYQFQPSEFTKFFMIIFLGKYFDKFNNKINKPYILLISLVIISPVIYLVFDQPDLSTSLVLVFLFAVIVFSAGISYKYIIGLAILAIPIVFGLFWYIQQPDQKLLDDYQIERILALQDPEKYELDTALQTDNSVQAIGSGQLRGKGLYQGKLNQYNYLPEPQTDFIFSIIGEEFGFVGCAGVLTLLLLLMLRVLWVAKDSPDPLGQIIGAGFVAVVAFHTFIHVGVTTGIVPNTGLPLPFVSYGLSSLWANMLALGLVLNLSMQRKISS